MMGKKVMVQFLASGLSGLLAFLALSLSARLFGAKILGEIAYLTGLLGIIFAFSKPAKEKEKMPVQRNNTSERRVE